MWTWEHPDGVHKAQINHILFRGKWRSSVRNCRAYSTVELGSDHRIVTAELKISQRVPRPDQKIVRRVMQALINSTDLQERYRIEVSNRFTALSNNFNEKSSQAKHDEVANILDKDRVTNQHILNVTQRKNLSDTLLVKQLRVLGHWLRRPDDATIKMYALYTTNQGKNRRGRPRATYVKSMQKVTGMDNETLMQLAEDREEWRRFVVGRFDPQSAG